jgi:hypothetical protein
MLEWTSDVVLSCSLKRDHFLGKRDTSTKKASPSIHTNVRIFQRLSKYLHPLDIWRETSSTYEVVISRTTLCNKSITYMRRVERLKMMTRYVPNAYRATY